MFLNDERYEDELGRFVERHEIDCLGTYKHTMDGFFTWCCGMCKKESSTRAHKIGGTVRVCPDSNCQKKNLLVRTDIRFVNQKMQAADRNDTSAERAIANALSHFGQGIAALGRR